ncbi:MAG: recombination mediator RecR [Elusimicrobiales bacterium]|nr:recombination mediator RecR [Elusimicrobiales bacterium]
MKILQRLIDNLRKFPSVGPKQAERFAIHILKASDKEIDELLSSIVEIRKNIKSCNKCNNYTLDDVCEICRDEKREKKICLVETPFDLISIEKTKSYNGRYFILGGNLVPVSNNDDFSLKIDKLKKIVANDSIEEVIIALDATTEGQITSLYVKKALSEINVKISQIAYGVPLGADIDYLDSFTLSHAIKKRTLFDKD